MEVRRFTKGLAFAAVAALATTPFVLASRPFLGVESALAVWSVFLTAAYLAVIAPEPVRGLRVGAASLALGLATLWLVGASASTLLLASAATIGIFRSGFLFRLRAPRALVVECALGLAASSFVELFVAQRSAGALALALGVWAFFLVESLYFLVRGDGRAPAPRSSARRSEEDPFERASRKADRLMSDWSPTS